MSRHTLSCLAARPVGTITRGTTNPDRLRRVDRWTARTMAPLLRAPVGPPVVVDLGDGASPVTVLELGARLRWVRPDVRVLGVEIDPGRVARELADLGWPVAGGAVRWVGGTSSRPVGPRPGMSRTVPGSLRRAACPCPGGAARIWSHGRLITRATRLTRPEGDGDRLSAADTVARPGQPLA